MILGVSSLKVMGLGAVLLEVNTCVYIGKDGRKKGLVTWEHVKIAEQEKEDSMVRMSQFK